MPASLAAMSQDERITLEKKLVRKIDMTLLPILMVMCEWRIPEIGRVRMQCCISD